MLKRVSKALGNQRGDLLIDSIFSSAVTTIVVLGVSTLFFVMNTAAVSTAEHTRASNDLRNVTQTVVSNQQAPAIGAGTKTFVVNEVPYTVWSEAIAETEPGSGVKHQSVMVATPCEGDTACTPASLDDCLVDHVDTLITDGGFALTHLGVGVDNTNVASYAVDLPLAGSGAGTPREARYLGSELQRNSGWR